MFTRILIPTDGFGLEDHAIIYAAQVFPDAELHVISVVDTKVHGIQYTTMLQDIMDESAGNALSHAEELFSEHGVKVKVKQVLYGIPSKVINNYANENEATFIIVRSYCQHGLHSPVLGSTIENLLKRTKVPVMVLSVAVDGVKPSRVLLASDGTHLSKNAENFALQFCQSLGATLVCLFVANPKKRGHVEFGKKVMINLGWKAKQLGVTVEEKLSTGDLDTSVIEASQNAQVVIMGAGRKNFLKRVVIGHMARCTCATSEKPVILVRGSGI